MSLQLRRADSRVPALQAEEICYAALDAFLPGALYRQLRLLSFHGDPCKVCFRPLGMVAQQLQYRCTCGASYRTHSARAGHVSDGVMGYIGDMAGSAYSAAPGNTEPQQQHAYAGEASICCLCRRWN